MLSIILNSYKIEVDNYLKRVVNHYLIEYKKQINYIIQREHVTSTIRILHVYIVGDITEIPKGRLIHITQY